MTTLNERAWTFADVLAQHADARRIGVSSTAGARIIDCGGAVPGGLQAGLEMARICLAGLADDCPGAGTGRSDDSGLQR